MLDLKQIESFYPKNLKPFKKNLLREYLQYKILEIIYDSEFGEKLVFMGRTAARIIHENTRFSEDLDFDNVGLSQSDFEHLTALTQRKLEQEGYTVEISNIFRSAFTCNIKISGLLFEYKLTGHRAEKILIKINTEPQNYNYQPDKIILNKFDVFLRINVVPVDILFAQKLYAIFGRRRTMGRDFYDAVFLLGKTKPNLDYLKLKHKVKDEADLKKRL
jgi:predicted nucleotidyltransferase component of viral defense system